ncbi:uncharacterized protein LOC143615269 [Bidens hawaiensis]|uniref:uncharacterized protein LOC143615269 n=1 Tax=Bidens hawaiensis TaxID=980011 RepID=UPI00404A58EA
MGFDFEIHFKPRRENNVADALSRIDIPSLLSISYPTTTWLEELRAYYISNKNGSQLVANIKDDPVTFPNDVYQNGLIYIKGKLLVPPISDMRQRTLQEFHSSFVGGHSGVNTTFKRLSSSFTWLGLK